MMSPKMILIHESWWATSKRISAVISINVALIKNHIKVLYSKEFIFFSILPPL